MMKITLLFVAVVAFGFTGQLNAQSVANQNFGTNGPDSAPTVLTINAGDITVNQGQPITAVALSNFVSDYFGDTSRCDDYFSFDLSVTGGIADGTSIVEGCAADFEGLDVTGFTTITLTSVDIDDWTDTVYFDIDLVVTYDTPSCPAPSSLTASNFTTTSASLAWTENGTSNNWDIEWGLEDFATTGTPNVNDTVDNPYELTGLSEGTTYDFYVRTDCGADDSDVSAWSGPFSFTTAFTAPDCATTPFPADGATGISGGDLTFTWTAPAAGPTPTSYNVYIYDDAAGTNPALITNVTTTSVDLINVPYNEELFWAAVPVNESTEAMGCAIWSFTTNPFPGYCLNIYYGSPYPATTFTPTTCDGTTPNNIITNAYASEYSNVQVVAGQTYEFRSSLPDLITISYDGNTAEAYGTTPLTWTATTDGVVRFYTHLDDDNCGAQGTNRTKSVLCGGTLDVGSFDAAALKVYPNPVKDVLNLSYTTEISSVDVYNMLGQIVLSKIVNANQESLNLSELNSGAYFVKVTINDATETIRVIKQ